VAIGPGSSARAEKKEKNESAVKYNGLTIIKVAVKYQAQQNTKIHNQMPYGLNISNGVEQKEPMDRLGQLEQSIFTATCFSNVAVMGSLDVRPSVRLSVRPSVTLVSSDHIH